MAYNSTFGIRAPVSAEVDLSHTQFRPSAAEMRFPAERQRGKLGVPQTPPLLGGVKQCGAADPTLHLSSTETHC